MCSTGTVRTYAHTTSTIPCGVIRAQKVNGSRFNQRRDYKTAPIDTDLNYSNIGRWSFDETDFGSTLGSIADVFVGQSSPRGRSGCGVVFFTSCVDGKLCFSLSYMKSLLSERYARFIVDHVRAFCEGEIASFENEDVAGAGAAAAEDGADPNLSFASYFDRHGVSVAAALPEEIGHYFSTQ